MLLTEEQAQTCDAAHDFAQRKRAPFAAERKRAAASPREALREIGRLGFRGMTVPPERDGAAVFLQGTNDIQRLVISRALGAEGQHGGRDR